jgi:cell division septum initiation protein DivIVA
MAEIRLRDVSPELLRKVEFIKKEFKEVQATTAIEKLIAKYPDLLTHIDQLSKRNTELHKKLAYYVDREKIPCTILQSLSRRK